MKRAVQFPLHTVSENKHRRGHWAVSAAKTAKERADVRLFLTQIDRPRLHLDDRPNEFVVTLSRIFVGELDDDNLGGALKGVRDEVAAWLGVDDRDRRVRWRYRQLGCEPGRWAVRIEVDDLEPGPDVERVLGTAPRQLCTPREQRLVAGWSKARRKGAPAALEQERLRFRASFALLPWDQDGGAPVVTELPFEGDGSPPYSIQIADPAGERVVFYRHPWRRSGVDAWLYRLESPPVGGDKKGT